MNPIELIFIAIRGLSVMTNNPALGGGSSVRLQEASKLLNFLGELLERGDEAHTELEEFAESVKAMADAGTAPNQEQWQTLQDRSDAAHDVIQAARREAEAEEAASQPDPEPEPQPEPEPEPDPTPEPESDPVPEPDPEPEPA